MLLRAAQHYPTIHAAVLEAVQNACDPDVRAKEIWININQRDRSVTITDNGCGITEDQFYERLGTVCVQHRKGNEATGKYGIGLISPLGKCKRFFFTSCPSPLTAGYIEWRFECADIIASFEKPDIPARSMPDFGFQSGKQPQKWRSMMRLEEIDADPSVSKVDMQDLIRGILTQHGNKMRKYETSVSIRIVPLKGEPEVEEDIQAPRFHGEALDEYVTENGEAGKVVVRLFRSPMSTRGGFDQGVVFGQIGDDPRLLMKQVSAVLASASDGVAAKAIEALKSGVFEGEIIAEKITVHVSRQHFDPSVAVEGLAVAVSRWFAKVGRKAFDEARESRRDTKNVDRAAVSVGLIEQLLKGHPELIEVLKGRFKYGTVGEGHTKVPKTRIVGEIEGFTAAKPQGNSGTTRTDRGESDRGTPRHERASHTPFIAVGPGNTRKIVVGSSIGFGVSFDTLEADVLWELDTERGLLTFNTTNQLWTAAELSSDLAVYQLQEFCILEVINMLKHGEPNQGTIYKFTADLEKSVVDWIVRGNSLRRKLGK